MKEIRISLDLQDYIFLCEKGFIFYASKYRIPINGDDFDTLIDGKIVSITMDDITFKIALRDIGYDLIFKYLLTSDIY